MSTSEKDSNKPSEETTNSNCKHEKAYGYCLAKIGDEMFVLCTCPNCGHNFERPLSELKKNPS